MKKRKFQAAVLRSLMAFACVLLSNKAPAQAASLGAEFEGFVQEALRYYNIPGAVVVAVKNDQVIYSRGFGSRDLVSNSPFTPDTLVNIDSLTKAFTSAGVGILIDSGKLKLDAPVSNALPSFKLNDRYASQNATLRDLLTHQVGLPRHDHVFWSNKFTPDEMLAHLPFLAPNVSFRQSFQYNNIMFMVASLATQAVADQPWQDFITNRILKPLGMNRTIFYQQQYLVDSNHASLYLSARGQSAAVGPPENADASLGAASLYSTGNDMAKWLIMQIHQGSFQGHAIFSDSYASEEQRIQVGLAPPKNEMPEMDLNGYGLGWFVGSYRGHKIVYHDGAGIGAGAAAYFLPEENVGVFVAFNASTDQTPDFIALQALDGIQGYPATNWMTRLDPPVDPLTPPEAYTKSPLPTDSYLGTYSNDGYGDLAIRADSNGDLWIDYFKSGAGYEMGTPFLNHLKDNSFRVENVPYGDEIHFETDSGGKVTAAIWTLQMEYATLGIRFNRTGDLPETEPSLALFMEKLLGFSALKPTSTIRTPRVIPRTIYHSREFERFGDWLNTN